MELQGFSDTSLEALLRSRRLDLPSSLCIAINIAAALAELHAAHLVYQVLRPENVWLDADRYDVRLVPAPAPGTGLPSVPPLPVRAEEWAYLSPEQTGRMNRATDHRSDLYSLGVILYRMLTDTLPFPASDPLTWVHCHIARVPSPPAHVNPSIPPILSDIVMKLLAKTAEDRYQSAVGLQSDLERCLSQWESSGRMDCFELGTRDIPGRFHLPQRLYGREAELAALMAAFERMAASGNPEVALVSGQPGTGKTSLVNELHRPIAGRHGLFLCGKFDQYQRDIPYATFSQAMAQLVQYILSLNEAEIAVWRQHLLDAVQHAGRLLIDLLPQLELVIGPQPDTPALPPREAQYRFQRVFRRFLGAAVFAGNPLVLFLDDLQWVDAASLALIQHLWTHSDTRHLMLVGAYRVQDVGEGHPLVGVMEAISKVRPPVEIHLGPLEPAALEQLVADTVRASPSAVAPLVDLIREKTAGNPYFVNQLLHKLHLDGLIVIPPGGNAWSWDLDRIKEANVTDNVVDLMASHVETLPAATRQAMQLASCLGSRFALADLALVADQLPAQTMQRLLPALSNGLLIPAAGSGAQGMEEMRFKWSHDRVQQAVHASIPEDELPCVHLGIGRALRAGRAPEQLADRLFDITDHFNAGADLILETEEIAEVAALNLAAGRKAKSSVAYASALGYFAAGVALLGPSWEQQHYELGFALHMERAECELLNGKPGDAARYADALLKKARTGSDKVRLYRLKLELHFLVGGEMVDGVQYEIEALAACGLALPSAPTPHDVAAAYQRVHQALGDRPIEAILDLPELDHSELEAILQIPPLCIYLDWKQGMLRIADMVQMLLVHGNCDKAIFWYGAFGVCLIGGIYRDYATAHRCTEANRALVQKRGALAQKGYAGHCAAWTSYWLEPMDSPIARLQSAFEDAVEFGDFNTCNYCAAMSILFMLNRGDFLGDVAEAARRSAEFIEQNRSPDWTDVIHFTCQFIRNLQGKTRDRHSFDDEHFDQAAFEATLTESRWRAVHLRYWALRLRASYLLGAWRQAADIAERAMPYTEWTSASVELRDFIVFHALTLAALFPGGAANQRSAWRIRLTEYQDRLKRLSQINPATFLHIEALVSAEIARIDGRHEQAAQLYEQSLEAARAGRFVHDLALAYELASRFYRARGFQAFAELYLCEARDAYGRWGADGKVHQLDDEHPELRPALPLTRAANLAAGSAQQLDLLSIIKVSQAISSEIMLDAVVDILLRTAVENAGAQEGYLLLVHKDALSLEAAAHVDGQEVHIQRPCGSAQPAALPDSMLNYVRRCQESVMLDDAAEPHQFTADPYFLKRNPKSVLCLPILRQSALIGLLYLENNLVTHAFTRNRIAVLELIASQAAISLENARLFTELRQENNERRRAEAALREREARIRRLVESNIIGIIFWEIDGRISDANDAFLRIIGYSRQDLHAGRIDWARLTPEAFRGRDMQALAELQRSGTCAPYEKEYIRRNGSRIPVLVGATFNEGSRRSGVAFILDLTERKQAEAERAARKIAEAANEAKSAFLANISHELRSPLNTMLGFGRLMERHGGLPRDVCDYLNIMLRSGEHLRTLINQVLDLAKIEAGKSAANEVEFDLHYLLSELRDMFAFRAEEKGLFLAWRRGNVPRVIRSDAVKLRQVLINLLGNALKFTSRGSIALTVTSEPAPPGLRLNFEVADTGVGISADEREHLFDPFMQAQAGRYAMEGSGLGLAISRDFVRLMGGDIRIDSTPGQGTTIRFDIAVQLPAAALAASPERTIRRVAGLEPDQARRRILIADDRKDARQLLTRLLEPIGFEVREATNGQEAVALALEWQPHLIWMDVRMPVMDGLEAARRIKDAPAVRTPAIIALTASGFDDERIRILESGFDDFLRKPFSEDDLFALMQKHLGVRFVYAETKLENEPVALTPDALASLPAALRSALADALRNLDTAAVERAIGQVENRALAHALALQAGEFQYGRLLQMIRNIDDKER